MKKLIAVALCALAPSCVSTEPRPLTPEEEAAVEALVASACDRGADELKALLSDHPEYLPVFVAMSSLAVSL